MGTTRKPRRSGHSGNIQHPRGQKKARQVQSNVKVMLTVLFDSIWWCITSTHHKAKTLTKNATWKSFIALVMCAAQETGPVGNGNVAAAS